MINAPTNLRSIRRGFTLIEVMVVIIIIIMLSGLALVVGRNAIDTARKTAERQVLVALKQAITNFENEFRFLPPLVNDNSGSFYPEAGVPFPALPGGIAGPVRNNPAYGNSLQPVAVGGVSDPAILAQHRTFLEGFDSGSSNAAPVQWDFRFSAHSLPYYLMGMLNDPGAGGKPIDGADGPRMTAPLADGAFSGRGKAYEAYYDLGSNVKRIGTTGGAYGYTFNDRWGRPIRYYRWEPRPADSAAQLGTVQATARTLVPRAVGDPRSNTKARGARFALVITGPDRETDMRSPMEVGENLDPTPPLSGSVADDIVEVEG